jgi:hypothetical protein
MVRFDMRTPLLLTALLAPSFVSAQPLPADVARERADRVQWLSTDPLSPAKALALTALAPNGVTLGPEGSDVLVAGQPRATAKESGGRVTLSGWDTDRILPAGRPTALRGVRLVPLGEGARAYLLVYSDAKPGKRPKFFPYLAAGSQAVTLVATTPQSQRILAPEGTAVELRARNTSAGADITVRDHGRGIAAGELERIWEPFYSGSDGTGLGLAVVRRLAREHEWTVEAANAADGGAEFRLRVPASTS